MKPVTDVITLQSTETAQNSNPSTSISALSAYHQKAKKVLLMDHVKTMPGPLVPSTNPELITGLIAKRYYLFFERNPEDGIANPAHVVTPARKRTAKASKEANKVSQAKSGGPGQISFSSSSLPILSHISIISRSSIKASVQQG